MLMAKKSTNRKFKISKLSIVVVMLVVSQAAIAYWFLGFMNAYMKSEEGRLPQIIKEFENSRYKHPVIDISEKRVYIPELRVFLPLNDTTRDLRYYIWEMADSPIKHIFFTVSAVVGNQIPEDAPSCDRMVYISTEKEDRSSLYKLVGHVKLDQGLKHVFQHETCSVYPQGALQELTQAVLLIKEY
jgi:hypothetical protein